uniref:Reverse transcriptase Ty1/copia-type domain-containing protein n=1 Tax=Tanacetum cinerariifolium TaxID=118510 RepID=A0A6L2KV54_TANCI|nr:hypothetical protein [Tanacetum cinerariifolium]
MTDYSLWEVIKNGNKVVTKTVRAVEQPYEPTTEEEKLDRKIEMKAIGTLLMALPNKDQLKFHSYQDAKLLMEDIEKSTNSTSSTNEANNTAYEVSITHTQGSTVNSTSVDNLSDAVIYAFLVSQPNSTQLAREDLEQINLDDLEEMDLQWEMAMLIIRARRERERDELKLTLKRYQNSSKSLNTLLESQVSDKDKSGLGYKAASPAIENFVNSSKMIENQENIRSRSDKGYHAVPSPYTGNYIPPKPDLMFIDEQVESESVDIVSTVSSSAIKTVESKVESVDVKNKGVCSTVETKPVKKNNLSLPIIKDWISDDESEVEFKPKVEDKNQNGVAKRKNKTLIEAARTMLVDSKFPTTFWEEAVNTACYVLNRALVIKPHNKIPYELIRGRPPLIDFMKPFGCPVTILNTRDNLRKFDKKAYEGFFVGYFMVRNGPYWLFDIDSLTISMNYVPVLVVFQTNGIVGTKDNIVAGQAKKKKEPKQEYILIPICTTDPLISQVPIGTLINDTRIFGNAYDDEAVEEEVDKDNMVSSYTIPDVPLTKYLKDHPKDQAIGTKWVFRNKKDERGIVIKNKARLVAQRHTQEEGIDYDELFAPVARIEAIRLFFAYDSFKDFVVYQMDVNSDFLYEKIEEEVYVCQPPGFEDPNFPDKVYNVKKALYGLHQPPRACTLMEPNKALVKDAEAEDVDVNLYRSMIGSLMYLTAYRLDITFTVCACVRDSLFDLEAYFDSDYDRASLEKKSITGGCQFLGKRLISWQCKKQTIVVNSTTEANNVATASCYGQVLWIQNQMLDYEINLMNTKIYIDNENETVYKEWKDKMEMAIITASSLEAEQDNVNINRTQSMQHLMSLFLRELVEVVVPGTATLPNDTIFKELTRMSAKTTSWNEFSSTMVSAIICLANNQKFNFSKYIFDHMVKHLKGGVKFLMFLRFLQLFLDKQVEGMAKHKEIYVISFHTKKIFADIKRQGQEDAFKQGKSIKEIDQDAETALVIESQGRMHDANLFGVDDLEVTDASVEVSVAPTTATTADVDDELTLEKTLFAIKAAKPKLFQLLSQHQKLKEHDKVADDDIAELKRCLEIVSEDDDDVEIKATPMSSKSPTIVDYKIYREGKKIYFKIIIANGNSQNNLTFRTMFKNLN